MSYSDLVAPTFATASLAAGAGSVSGGTAHTISTVENLAGGPGDDILTGDGAGNTLAGAGGDDTLTGGGGDDVLDGGADDDTVTYADRGAHDITASLIDDAGGEAGVDTTYVVDREPHRRRRRRHADRRRRQERARRRRRRVATPSSYAGRAAAVVASLATGTGGAEGDEYARVDNLTGGNGDDTLSGDDESNVLDGGPRHGHRRPTPIAARPRHVVASLAATGGQTGTAEADSYPNVENLTGGDGNDTLTGDADANVLDGGARRRHAQRRGRRRPAAAGSRREHARRRRRRRHA